MIVLQAVEEEVLRLVADKNRGESDFRRAVRGGMRVSDAFRTYNML